MKKIDKKLVFTLEERTKREYRKYGLKRKDLYRIDAFCTNCLRTSVMYIVKGHWADSINYPECKHCLCDSLRGD